jgi:ATPase subunit of ABC transporter with duplicated ATPase domains
MISFSNINKQYGKQLLFVDASFQLNPGEKVGLVGPKGAGKTTLFRMVVGEETPDEGAVSVPKKLTIGYFRQDVEEMQGRSVLDEAIAGSGRVGDLHRTVRWSIVTRLIGSWLALHHNQKHHTNNGKHSECLFLPIPHFRLPH